MDPHRRRLPSPRIQFSSHTKRITIGHYLFVAVLLISVFAAKPGRASLPPGWSQTDFGSPGQLGSADYSNGVWTVQGGGTDICSSDQFHLLWTPISGEGSIVAQVRNLVNAPAGQAGIMLRADTGAQTPDAAVVTTTNNGITFQWRATTGGSCSFQIAGGAQGLGVPLWLKLTRSGNSFSGFYSVDGTNWNQIGSSQTVPMGQPVLAGLAVSAGVSSGLCTATFSDLTLPTPILGIYRELWNNLSSSAGDTLAVLTNTTLNANWPNNPDTNSVYPSFETQTNTGINYYGQRLRSFIVPPTNGNFTFWISSDNTSELLLSSDETAANAGPIAWVNTFTAPREWTKESNQQSSPVQLQAGHRYYLEALMQHSAGNDNLAVRWQLPNGSVEEPLQSLSIVGTRLIPCDGLDTPLGIYVQPTNLVVADGHDAAFALLVTNRGPVSYQWLLNGANAPGVGNQSPVYAVSNASPLINNGQLFSCVVSNSAGVVTSTPALLTVLTDTVPPMVLRAVYRGPTNLQLVFSEALQVSSATNPSNYVLTNGTPILGAYLAPDNLTVTLITAPLVANSNYFMVLNGIRDRATTPNTIGTNTLVFFFTGPYTPVAVGGATPAGSINGAADGFDVTGGGKSIGSTSDQFQFAYELLSGDFDIMTRLNSFSRTDSFAQAGLIAREDLTASGRFAAVLATPSLNGVSFESRSAVAAGASVTGNVRVNYPDMFLRLQRIGSQFTGYASYDGSLWQQLGTISIGMTNPIYFGMAVCSHTTNYAAIAQFRDISSVTNPTLGTLVLPSEPLGPSSRKTPIAISEIMYKPAPRADTNNLEFLEIYNSNPWFQDISGYRLSATTLEYTFPPGTVLPGGAFLVLAASPQSMQAVYGVTNVMGPYTGSLKKADTLQLFDEVGAVLLTVPYSNVYPWPVATDGTGHSLVLSRPTYGEEDPRAWDISDVVGGSPGQSDGYRSSPLRNVVINEFLAHTDPPDYDYIELYNHANQPVDISGCILTDDVATNKFVVPAGTIIPARGFVFYSETNMNFRLSAAGETIYLKNPDQSRYLDAVQFGGQENGVATGRCPDGANEFYRLNAKTPGASNATLRQSDIVINELMYDPISGNDDDQYIELYNRSGNSVNLGGWQLSDAVSFTFPSTVLTAGGYLVVARNAAHLRTNYANLTSLNCLGDYAGKLSHNGEHLALTMPDTTVQTNNSGVVTTNLIHIVVNDLTYSSGGRWGQWSAGGGSSLELIDPNANNRLAANWADSDETQKSSWANIETTGVLDNGANYDPTIDYAQIGILDVGECLVDNIEVRAGTTGANLVLNPDFETGLGNWWLQGDHYRSTLENSGYASSHSLHMRCSDRMWTGDNSCQMALAANTLGGGQTATLRFKARWLHGWPEVLLRLNGNWLEATGPLPVPTNLGTPGAPNSRLVTNAGPAVYAVTHTPTVPASGQSVVVTARVHDADGVQNLTLFYRIDPSTIYTSVAMRDDGTGGDDIAGDGVFSATIPGRGTGTIVAFYLAASDTKGAVTRFPALLNDNAPVRECVVTFGDGNPSGSFPVYHLWITQTNVMRWSNLSDLSNESHDCTMVNGTRVIYNAQGRFAGSPYHQGFDTPYGNLCHYKWIFPDDDKFLGATSYNKLHQPGNGAGDDASIQREQLANSFLRSLGAPWLNRRYVAVFVNGHRRGTLMEDAQTPDSDVVKEHFPNDTNGWLYKMQPWFEFGPFPQGAYMPFNNYSWCNLMPYITTGGVKKIARYRYNFLVRRSPVSATDFTNVFSLVDAASSYGSPNYVANMENLADMENWMRVFAANHAAGNWDSYGCNNAQNLYGYLGTQGTKYSLMMWDFNIVFGNSSSWGPGQNLFSVNGQDPNTQNIYSEPTFRRMYWRALQELVNGPLNTANSGPLLDAKYNAFLANGLSLENPSAGIKGWLTSARTSIASQLAAENATSFVLNSPVVVNNTAVITGTAPVSVKTVLINGVEYAVKWPSVTGFSITVPLQPGSNQLSIVGVDIHGQLIAGTSNNVAVVYSGSVPSPVGQIVLNEIMPSPPIARSEYVELYNAGGFTYDLSGWQFKGLSYTFPQGSMLGPNSYLVLTADRPSFAAAYGATIPVFDTFSGTLQGDGETLTLIQPGTNAISDLTVAKVRYSTAAPWPTNANGTGSSLQLIDPHQDNWRAGNWSTVTSNSTLGPQWQYVTLTGTAPRPILLICMHGTPGDVYVDDLKLVAGSVPEAGANLLSNGDFEMALTGPWTVSTNMSSSMIGTAVKHSGNGSLHVIATTPGDTIPLSIWENTAPIVTNGTYTLSYWYLPSTNGTQLLIRLSGTSPGSGQVYSLQNIQPQPTSSSLVTPGAPNSTLTTLPPFPPLWINELQADNLTGITNRVGQHVAWLELYNPTTNLVDLTGLYLANNYANLTAWGFPAGTSVNPGEFKVIFADGQPNLSTATELHTSFVLQSGSGSLALTRLYNGQPQVLDYVDYTNVAPNHAYGSVPDGQSFDRQELAFATPGSSNNIATGPSSIPYQSVGWVYTQNFDTLPNPGATSINSANPVTINGMVYSLANPFDFAYPSLSSGGSGGLGLSGLEGWYGLGTFSSKFGATDGDQTTGGVISFGLPNDSNRAAGLLATSSTGPTAVGAKFINYTGRTLNYINLQFAGELWRQSDVPKSLTFYYFIDPTASASFSTTATAFIPSLNVNFPTSPGAVGGMAVDGTAAANQSLLSIQSQLIMNWLAGAALWLVWEMSDATGKAQGLGIDNLIFSASDQFTGVGPSLDVQAFGTNLVMSWTTTTGQVYQIEYKDDLNTNSWTALGTPITGNGATVNVTNDVTESTQRFYRVRLVP